MRKFLPVLFGLIAILGLLGALGSLVAENSLNSQAKLIQRVEQSAEASLFGDEGTPIGSAQQLIITDPKAFTGSKTPEGAEVVSENYLREQGIYPLQAQTVSYVSGLVRLGSLAMVIFGIAGFVLIRRKLANQNS
jgi:hypothetical protein